MMARFGETLLRLTARRKAPAEPAPLLLELVEKARTGEGWDGKAYPFACRISSRNSAPFYEIGCTLGYDELLTMRKVVSEASSSLEPREVDPLTFPRLVEVLTQHSAQALAILGVKGRVKELAELGAYEAIGLSRILALAKDDEVTEFYVDSDFTPVYLDHATAGRCETGLVLTERERDAIKTHLDTFSGYTLDYKTPSLKNDLPIAGARLRMSLDLEPVSVNRFALDVRRLDMASLSLPQLVALKVLTEEAAVLLVAWLEAGGNVTIIGETGTGKTTLLNALDEQVDRRLRRLYIEDAVETRDLLELGYHQMKVKVDPFERGDDSGRTKESEIVKALHRSPDMVVLSEIQSEEHSRAFFQALAAGARGIQTFHASTAEQAIRRWVNLHRISEQCLLDLGVLVQMSRPDRLKQERFVQRICLVVQEAAGPKLRNLFMRDGDSGLVAVASPELSSPRNVTPETLQEKMLLAKERIEGAAPAPA